MAVQKNIGRITKRTVDAMPLPVKGKARLWDSELKGFCVCAYPTGRKVYVIGYRDRSTRFRWFTIGKHGDPWTAEAARIKARELLGNVATGDFPHEKKIRERLDSTTVAELIERYLAEGPLDRPNKRESSWLNDKGYLYNHVVPHLGHIPFRELHRDQLVQFQHAVANGIAARRKPKRGPTVRGGRGAAVHALRCLSAMYGWAISRDMAEKNPCQSVQRLADGRRDRYLSLDEARRLFSAMDELERTGVINPLHADCLRLIAYTAARKGEIMGLKWSEVDADNQRLLLPPARHKTGGANRPKAIPLSNDCMTILERCRRHAGTSAYVFPIEPDGDMHIKTLAYTWDKVMAKAGITDFRIHDLRHAYASFAINAGFSLKAIGENLGHARASTTERYAHLLLDARRPVSEVVANAYKGNTAAN